MTYIKLNCTSYLELRELRTISSFLKFSIGAYITIAAMFNSHNAIKHHCGW